MQTVFNIDEYRWTSVIASLTLPYLEVDAGALRGNGEGGGDGGIHTLCISPMFPYIPLINPLHTPYISPT